MLAFTVILFSKPPVRDGMLVRPRGGSGRVGLPQVEVPPVHIAAGWPLGKRYLPQGRSNILKRNKMMFLLIQFTEQKHQEKTLKSLKIVECFAEVGDSRHKQCRCLQDYEYIRYFKEPQMTYVLRFKKYIFTYRNKQNKIKIYFFIIMYW